MDSNQTCNSESHKSVTMDKSLPCHGASSSFTEWGNDCSTAGPLRVCWVSGGHTVLGPGLASLNLPLPVSTTSTGAKFWQRSVLVTPDQRKPMFAPYSAALTQPRFPALLAFFDCGNLVCSRVRQMFGL